MPDKKYKAVVVGCGAIGALLEADPKRPKPATHAGAFRANKKTILVALVDTDKKNLAAAGKLFPEARRYSDLRSCLRQECPDVVAVATRAGSHRAIIKECARSGVKTIVCEKPLAETVADAKAIEALVKRHEMLLVLNYQRRFFKLFERARRYIAAGKLGKIEQAACYYSNGLYNNGGHSIDALHFVLGNRVGTVLALHNQHNTTHPAGDRNTDALMIIGKSTPVTLQSLDQSKWGIHELRIYGEKGMLTLGGYGYDWTFTPVAPSLFGGVPQLAPSKAKTVHCEESMVTGALAHALECMEKGNTVLSPASSGTDVLRVLEALTLSSVSGGKRVSIRYA